MQFPEQLLSEVREEIEKLDAPVKAAALLHVARVVARFDSEEGQRVLERGIALVAEMREPPGQPLLGQAVYLAAAVAPQRAFQLMPSVKGPFHRISDGVIYNALSHGFPEDAAAWLSEPPDDVGYPFRAASQAIGYSRGDEEAARKIMRGAIRAWRKHSKPDRSEEFEEIFVYCRRWIPAAEAEDVVREIVDRIRSDKDGPTTATFRHESKVAKLSSTRESRLFNVYGLVLRLDAELAAELCRQFQQLAAAVKVFPRGYQDEFEVPPAERGDEKTSDRCEQPDYMTVNKRHRLLPIPEAIKTDFREPFESALRLYGRDTDPKNPNEAPKECWPSTNEYRNILFKAGQHPGGDAARLLNRIPNGDLLLLAQIEWMAAMLGLPKLGGMTIPPRPKSIWPWTPLRIM